MIVLFPSPNEASAHSFSNRPLTNEGDRLGSLPRPLTGKGVIRSWHSHRGRRFPEGRLQPESTDPAWLAQFWCWHNLLPAGTEAIVPASSRMMLASNIIDESEGKSEGVYTEKCQSLDYRHHNAALSGFP